MLSSILAIVFVLRLSRNSTVMLHYAMYEVEHSLSGMARSKRMSQHQSNTIALTLDTGTSALILPSFLA